MVCNSCGTTNQDGVKFCAGCGAQLNVVETQAAAQAPVRRTRPAGKPKAKNSGMVRIVVAAFMLVALIFGIVQLFVDYVVKLDATQIETTEEKKSIQKTEAYDFKKNLYEMNKDEEWKEETETSELRSFVSFVVSQEADNEELQMLMMTEKGQSQVVNTVENKINFNFGKLKLGNLIGGIGCILVIAIGVLHFLGMYDQLLGGYLKGRTPVFAMGLIGAVTALLQVLLCSGRVVRMDMALLEISRKMKVTANAHWTAWAFLVICLLAMVYDMRALSRKRK